MRTALIAWLDYFYTRLAQFEVAQPRREHEVSGPFRLRALLRDLADQEALVHTYAEERGVPYPEPESIGRSPPTSPTRGRTW